MTMRTRSRSSAAAVAAAAAEPQHSNEHTEEPAAAPPADTAAQPLPASVSAAQVQQHEAVDLTSPVTATRSTSRRASAATRATAARQPRMRLTTHRRSGSLAANVDEPAASAASPALPAASPVPAPQRPSTELPEGKEEKEEQAVAVSRWWEGGEAATTAVVNPQRPAAAGRGARRIQLARRSQQRMTTVRRRPANRRAAAAQPAPTVQQPPQPHPHYFNHFDNPYNSADDEDYSESDSEQSDEDEKEEDDQMYDEARVAGADGMQQFIHDDVGFGGWVDRAPDGGVFVTVPRAQMQQHHNHHHHDDHHHHHAHAHGPAASMHDGAANKIKRNCIEETMAKKPPYKPKRGRAQKGKRRRSAATVKEEELAALVSQLEGLPSVPPMSCAEVDSLFMLASRSPSSSSSSSSSTIALDTAPDFNESELSPFVSLFSDVRSLGASLLRPASSLSSSAVSPAHSSAPVSPTTSATASATASASASAASHSRSHMVDVEQLRKLDESHRWSASHMLCNAIQRSFNPLLSFIDEWLSGQLPEPPVLVIDDTAAEDTGRAGKKRKKATRAVSRANWLQLVDAGIDPSTDGDVILRSGSVGLAGSSSAPATRSRAGRGMIDLTDDGEADQDSKEATVQPVLMDVEEVTRVKDEQTAKDDKEEKKTEKTKGEEVEDEDQPIKLEDQAGLHSSRAIQFIIDYHQALASSSSSSSSSSSMPSFSSKPSVSLSTAHSPSLSAPSAPLPILTLVRNCVVTLLELHIFDHSMPGRQSVLQSLRYLPNSTQLQQMLTLYFASLTPAAFQQHVTRIQNYLTLQLTALRQINESTIGALHVLSTLFSAYQLARTRQRLLVEDVSLFTNDAVNRDVDLFGDYHHHFLKKISNDAAASPMEDNFTWTRFSHFLFTTAEKSEMIRHWLDGHWVQEQVQQAALPTQALTIHLSRQQLVPDLLNAIARTRMERGAMELRKPLHVVFSGEEGIDAGGLKKECLSGDHVVMTRSGWRSIVVIHREFEDARLNGVALPVIEVSTFNLATSAMEWKRVTDTQRFPAVQPGDRLFRMQGEGMDVVATGSHRMLTGAIQGGAPKLSATSFGFTTVDKLTALLYAKEANSELTEFEHHERAVVVRCAANRQPAYKFVIKGMEKVCDWWWQRDRQLGFLRFLGFWLGDGCLDVTSYRVCVRQRKLEPLAGLIDLLDEVFPRWWSRNTTATDENDIMLNCFIHCPPLFEWLRVMAVGPAGYNPLDPKQLRKYPHFDHDGEVARAEAASDYYRPRARASKWTEAAMLDAFAAGPVRRPCRVCNDARGVRLSCSGQCHSVDAITRAHPACVGRSDEEAFQRVRRVGHKNKSKPWPWFCPHPQCQEEAAQWSVKDEDEEEDEEEEVVVEDEETEEMEAPTTQAAGAQIVWNGGAWDIDSDGYWFHRKRWLGSNVASSFANLSKAQAVALLEGFNRADGTGAFVQFDADGKPTGSWRCTNSSMPLIHHLQLIGQLADARVDLTRHSKQVAQNKGSNGRTVTTRVDHWALTLCFSKVYGAEDVFATKLAKPVDVSDDVDARGYYQYKDDGFVYDLTVADNGNFLTQRLSMKRIGMATDGVVLRGVRAHPVYVGNCITLACDSMFNAQYGMFAWSEETRTFWFNPHCQAHDSVEEMKGEYQLLGTVIGMALLNNVLLPNVAFPPVVYVKLLGLPLSFIDLRASFPQLFQSLSAILNYDGKETVEETFGLTFTVDSEVMGVTHSHPLLPNGDSTPVTAANRHEYVRLFTKYQLEDSIAVQFDAFSRGFWSVLPRNLLAPYVQPADLEMLVCGQREMDFQALEAGTKYEGFPVRGRPHHGHNHAHNHNHPAGYPAHLNPFAHPQPVTAVKPAHPVIRHFWSIVHSLSADQQRRLLHFVTGSASVPVKGLSELKLVIANGGSDVRMLPSSRTCFSTLMLPLYKTEAELRKKLLISIEHNTGFGMK